MDRILRVARNVLLIVLSVTGTVLVIELSAHVLRLNVPFFLHPSSDNCMRRSRLLSLEFEPNCTGMLSDTPLRTNTLGLRGPEIRDDGSRRILALGDSCTWGWKVDEQQSYPAVMQGLLDVRYGPGSYQVVNAGFPGNTSYQGLRYLRDRGLGLKPWLVIAGYGFNDLTRDGNVADLIERQGHLMPVLELDDLLLDNSRMYAWLRWQLAEGSKRNGLLETRVNPDDFAKNMAQIIDLSQQHGAQVMLIDFLLDYSRAFPQVERYRDVLVDLARRRDLPLVRYESARFDIVHPTAEGYRTLATAIVDQIPDGGDARDSPSTDHQ